MDTMFSYEIYFDGCQILLTDEVFDTETDATEEAELAISSEIERLEEEGCTVTRNDFDVEIIEVEMDEEEE